MLFRTSVIAAVVAISAQIVSANTPACLLEGIKSVRYRNTRNRMLIVCSTQPNPANVNAVCKNSTSIVSYLNHNCGGNVNTAVQAFQSVCQSAGVTVGAYKSNGYHG